MIDKFYIAATEDQPEITLDMEGNIFEIRGRSLPENVIDLFSPVFGWLKEYFNNPLQETVFSIKLEYYNSATEKKLADLLKFFETQTAKGSKLKVLWYYEKNDFTMQAKGKDLLSIFDIQYEIIAIH